MYGEDQNLNDFFNSCWIDIGEREENWREENQKQAEALVGWLGGRLTCNQFAPWALSVDRPTLYCLTESWGCQLVNWVVDRPTLCSLTESWECQLVDRLVGSGCKKGTDLLYFLPLFSINKNVCLLFWDLRKGEKSYSSCKHFDQSINLSILPRGRRQAYRTSLYHHVSFLCDCLCTCVLFLCSFGSLQISEL